MATRKLTLSADAEVIRHARGLARQHGTTISGMFARLIRAMVRQRRDGGPATPLAQRARGMISLPKGKSEADVLAEALSEKYGLRR